MLNFVVDTVYKPMAFSLQFVDPLSFGFKSIRRRCRFERVADDVVGSVPLTVLVK